MSFPIVRSAFIAMLFAILGSVTVAGSIAAEEKPTAEKPAADPAKIPTRFECRWVDRPLKIDGVADEPEWKTAQVIDTFYPPWLKKKDRPAETATRARLLWDREYLYFVAEMEDHDLFADVTEHDGNLWDNDVFELFFKPAVDKTGYYEFEINAANAVFDMFIPKQGQDLVGSFVKANKFHVESKVKLRGTLNQRDDRDEGWSVEGRIPWRDFIATGGRPNPKELWKFALCRYDYTKGRDPELSSCAPLQHPSFHRHEDYAMIEFVGPREPTPAERLPLADWKPMTTSKVVGSPDPPPPFRAVRVAPKLVVDFPVFVAPIPGTRRWLFIHEKSYGGRTWMYVTSESPDSGERDLVWTSEDEGVAYSAAFHPRFAENGFVYVGWNSLKKTRVTRYTLDRANQFRIVPNSARTIIEWDSNGHNGGAVAFGLDGMLLVTSGDGTSDSDADVVGQRLDRFGGKVLRIDVERPDKGRAYSVPKDNPFVGQKNTLPETWAYGLRNPWRMTVDAKTGHVWVANNGQDLWEQAYWIERGANYGWSVFEGSHPFYPHRVLGPTPAVPPTFEHPHSEARSLSGGVVYYGKRFPELQGCFIYGDFSTGKIWAGKHDGQKVVQHKEIARSGLGISCIAVDADGELLITNHRAKDDGGFFTLERNTQPYDPNAFPRTLSATGLFKDVARHEMQPGAIPYSVNAPLWSDGAHKERYFILPPSMGPPGKEEPPRIEYTNTGGWKFPEGTILLKSFALEPLAAATGTPAADPARRRWIETRLLVKDQGEWVGYSYAWNENHTDATLVASEGRDQEWQSPGTPNPSGEKPRGQLWRYPSRTECMVCHSRAANFALGTSELQMNRDHDYNGQRANQIALYERLGLFKVD